MAPPIFPGNAKMFARSGSDPLRKPGRTRKDEGSRFFFASIPRQGMLGKSCLTRSLRPGDRTDPIPYSSTCGLFLTACYAATAAGRLASAGFRTTAYCELVNGMAALNGEAFGASFK